MKKKIKHLQDIFITAIPHSEQIYDTCGDYEECSNLETVDIRISQLSSWQREACVALHEFVEFILVKNAGISLDKITDFDIAFEKKRKKGNTDEPGDSKNAPYFSQHQFATMMEKLLVKELGISWKDYSKEINLL